MTVYISADAKNLREELASLRNQGGYEERQFYFDNLVTNGTFDTNVSGWSAYNGSTISHASGTMLIENTASNNGGAQQAITAVVGKTYVATLDVSNGATYTKGLYVQTAPTTGIIASITTTLSDTQLSVTFVATTATTYITTRLTSGAVAAAYNVDNISVFEVDANDDVVHRMPKGWVPLHVYEDGLLQRAGAAHDYEVVYDGFDYYVKPAVTPGATTETCVIGVRK